MFRLNKVFLHTYINANYTWNNSRDRSESAMNVGDIFDENLKPGDAGFINRYLRANRGKGTSYNINAKQTAEIRMPYNADLVNAFVTVVHDGSKMKNWGVSNRITSSELSILNDHSSDPAHSTHINAAATYEHRFYFGLTLKPGYDFDFTDRRNERMLDHYLPDSVMQEVPVHTDTISFIHDINQSFVTKTRTTRHAAMLTAVFNLGNVYFDVHLPYTWITDRMSDTRANSVTRHTGAFDPGVTAYWKWFTAKYKSRKYTPGANQVLDYTDDSNLTVIRKGNPDLKDWRYHEASLLFKKNDMAHKQQYSASIFYDKWDNALSNAVTFDPSNGVSTIITRNIDGNYKYGGWVSYYKGFGKDGRFAFNGYISANQTRSAAYASLGNSYVESIVNSTRLNSNLALSYTCSRFMLNVSAYPGGLFTRGNLDSFIRTNAFSGGVSLNGWVNLPLGFYLESAIRYNFYRGYNDPAMNTNEVLWTAEIQNTFGKKKEWTVRLEGYDLLNQLTGISRTVNAQGITETRRNLIGRFVMLHLQYRFSYTKANKKNKK